MTAPLPQHLLLVGTGLIGTSLALALQRYAQEKGQTLTLYGWDINPENAQTAKTIGAINVAWSGDWAQSLAQHINSGKPLDVIIIAVPLFAYSGVLRTINTVKDALPPTTLITDVGSTKSFVVEKVRELIPSLTAQFVPAHPIAGREKHGPTAATPELFVGQSVIVTPLPENPLSAINRIVALWQRVGARTETMSPESHDSICASISHLPHLLSFALVADLLSKPGGDNSLQYAAGGFRDFTRIAGSSPTMWHDIFLANRDIINADLDHLIGTLQSFRTMMTAASKHKDEGNLHSQTLMDILTQASHCRQAWGKARDQ